MERAWSVAFTQGLPRPDWSLGECPGAKFTYSGQSCNGFVNMATQKRMGSGASPFVGVFPCYSSVCPGLSGALDMAETAGEDKTVGWSPVI